MIKAPNIQSVSELLSSSDLKPDKNLVEQIYLTLRYLIETVQLLPLQRISESEVSDSLGASRTPVREAMIRLTNDGLVKVVAKSGTYVNPINIDRYCEAAFMRTLVEVGVVQRAAMSWNDNPDNELLLSAPFKDQQVALQQENYFAFARADEEFHFNIFCVAKMPGLWHSLTRGQPDLSRVRHLRRVFQMRRTEGVLNEHLSIIDAIRSGSPDRAEAAMKAHLGTYEDEIAKLTENPHLVDYITCINEPSPRNARTFAANAEIAKEQTEDLRFPFHRSNA